MPLFMEDVCYLSTVRLSEGQLCCYLPVSFVVFKARHVTNLLPIFLATKVSLPSLASNCE